MLDIESLMRLSERNILTFFSMLLSVLTISLWRLTAPVMIECHNSDFDGMEVDMLVGRAIVVHATTISAARISWSCIFGCEVKGF